MTDFPILWYTSASKIPRPFIYLRPEKGVPFGRSLPAYAIIASTPPPGYLYTVEPLHNGYLGAKEVALVKRWSLWGGRGVEHDYCAN